MVIHQKIHEIWFCPLTCSKVWFLQNHQYLGHILYDLKHILRCENNRLTGSIMNAKIFKFGFIRFIAIALALITVVFVPAYDIDFSMRNSPSDFLGRFESYVGRKLFSGENTVGS